MLDPDQPHRLFLVHIHKTEGKSDSSFREDSRGRLYATSLDGAAYRLVRDEN